MPFIQPPASAVAATPPLNDVTDATASVARSHSTFDIIWDWTTGGLRLTSGLAALLRFDSLAGATILGSRPGEFTIVTTSDAAAPGGVTINPGVTTGAGPGPLTLVGGSGHIGAGTSGATRVRGGTATTGTAGDMFVSGGQATGGIAGNLNLDGGEDTGGGAQGTINLRAGLGQITRQRINSTTDTFFDALGNELLVLGPGVAAAVNEITITNAAATVPVEINATGGDTNIEIRLVSKGSANVRMLGGSPGGVSASGGIILQPGTPTDGSAGTISLLGTAGVGVDRGGTTITGTAGNSTGTAVGGAINFTAGSAVDQSGGGFIFTTGGASGATRPAGSFEFRLGTPGAGGATGSFQTPGIVPGVTAVKVANYSVVASDFLIPCDTSGGGFTITLPATPINGQLVNIKKTTTDVNVLTIGRNGNTIDGVAANLTTAAINRPNFQLQFQTSVTDWRIL